MTGPTVIARDLGKWYPTGGARGDRAHDVFERVLRSPLQILRELGRTPVSTLGTWALRGASFSVRAGEVVGIVGRNGAGKSVLLRLLARVSAPSEGELHLRGSVAPLLEVGAGFHSELSGRDNIYLNGTILGMSLAEVHRRVEAIEEFAELDVSLDEPIKHYSSGTRMRLGFAVATQLDRDIYLLDEVLAVGDEAFQAKCLRRVRELADLGKTILMVSHSAEALAAFCSRGLLIEHGTLAMDAPIDAVLAAYRTDR